MPTKIGPSSSQGPRGKRPPQPGVKNGQTSVALMPSSRLAAVGILAMARRSTAFEFKSAQNKEAYALEEEKPGPYAFPNHHKISNERGPYGESPRSKKR